MKLLSLAVFNVLLIATIARAETETCFRSQAEYTEVKEKLPAVLQKIPFYFTGEPFGISAGAGSVEFSDETIRFFFNAIQDLKKPIESQVVKICATNLVIQFTFPVGPPESVKIKSTSEVRLRDKLTVKLTTKDHYLKVAQQILKTADGGAFSHSNPKESRNSQ